MILHAASSTVCSTRGMAIGMLLTLGLHHASWAQPSPSSPRAPSSAFAPRSSPDAAFVLHRQVSSPRGYDANAYWIEGPDSLVLIDALMLRSDARMLVAALTTTGKPLAGILITHPHADHFGGLPALRAAFLGVPVFATQATADGMRRTHDARTAENGWLLAYGEDYDRHLVMPDHIVPSGALLTVGGSTFTVRDYGPMESENNTVFYSHTLQALFTGDATVAGAVYYVGEGHSREALAALPKIATDFPDATITYSGHYAPLDTRSVIADNIDQVRLYRAATALLLSDSANRRADGMLTPDAALALLHSLRPSLEQRSTYGLPVPSINVLNVNGLIPELARERASGLSDTTKARVPAITQTVRDAMRPLLFLVGRWQRGDFTLGHGGVFIDGAVSSGPYHYRLTFSFDAVQQRYRASSIDDVSGLMDIYEGTRSADGTLVLDNLRSGTHYLGADKIPVHNRLQFTPLADGTWRWLVESSTDGTRWVEVQRVTMQAGGSR